MLKTLSSDFPPTLELNSLYRAKQTKTINEAIGSSFKLQNNPLNFYSNTENKKKEKNRHEGSTIQKRVHHHQYKQHI